MGEPVTLEGPVLVVGAGLLGTSIGLALRRRGVAVWFRDVSTENLRTALGLGAGQLSPDIAPPPQLVVVAVPPNVIGETLRWALTHHPKAVVTDVGSIKTGPLEQLPRLRAGRAVTVRRRAPDGGQRTVRAAGGQRGAVRRAPVGGHAAPGLQPARPSTWCSSWSRLVGATAVQLSPDEHDRAVARTSHLPHLLASLVAGRLAEAPPGHLALSGQGVRDVTRVAAGDPELWQQIVSGNAPAVVHLLGEVRDQLDALIVAVSKGQRGRADRRSWPRAWPVRRPSRASTAGPCGPRRRSSSRCPTGRASWPGCSRTPASSGVNIEDVRIDHDPGRPTGLVELVVADDSSEHLLASLESRGWVTHR